MIKKFFLLDMASMLPHADLCTALDDESILKSPLLFWFKDEDWLGYTKIFDYFTLKIEKEMQK